MPDRLDYVIDAVRMDSTNTSIESCRLWSVTWDQAVSKWSLANTSSEWKVSDIVRYIEAGYVFRTLYEVNGQKMIGSQVEVVGKGSAAYLRTDKNPKQADNLLNLPRLPSHRW